MVPVIARSIKEYVRTLVARAGLAGVHARVRLWQGKNVGHLFTRTRAESLSAIYRNKAWQTETSNKSLSGPGSELAQTETIRQQLPGLLEALGIRTLLDIISGDFRLLNLTRHPFMFPAPTAQIADNEMLPDRIPGVCRVENVARLVANRARSLAQHLSNS